MDVKQKIKFNKIKNKAMPGDSLNLNNKAVAQNTYDAIVIGSGISGGWAAKELTEKGVESTDAGTWPSARTCQRLCIGQ